EELVTLVEAYAKEQGLWHEDSSPDPMFSERLELDLSTVTPSLAGPTRPQDRVPLERAQAIYRSSLATMLPELAIDEADGERQPGGPPEQLPYGVEDRTVDESSAQSFPASDPPSIRGGRADEPPAKRRGVTAPQ